jgi:hypothetical protein
MSILFNEPATAPRGIFVEQLSRTYVAQQSVTKNIAIIVLYLVTPKARAKHENCSTNRPQSDLSSTTNCDQTCSIDLRIWSHFKVELSLNFCSTNRSTSFSCCFSRQTFDKNKLSIKLKFFKKWFQSDIF